MCKRLNEAAGTGVKSPSKLYSYNYKYYIVKSYKNLKIVKIFVKYVLSSSVEFLVQDSRGLVNENRIRITRVSVLYLNRL